MIEIEMILKILNEANKPLMSKEISKHIYHKFDGFEIDKKTIKDILWNDLKDEVFFNRKDFTYYSKNKVQEKNKKKIDPLDSTILNDIFKILFHIQNINDVTVQKINDLMNEFLYRSYAIQDIRRVYNKNDIKIFEEFHLRKDNFELKDFEQNNRTVKTEEISKNNFLIDDTKNFLTVSDQRNYPSINDRNLQLTHLSKLHLDALCWFVINKNKTINYIDVSGEKRFNSGNIFLFNSAKGIHKPRTESYVLSIKVLLDSSYNDKIEEANGSWTLKYHKEDGNEWTNEGLIKCMKSKVPIGLFYQIKRPPAPIYRVYGLGLIHSYDGVYFFIKEIIDSDYGKFDWDPEWKETVSNDTQFIKVSQTDISKENTFLRFSTEEQDEVMSFLKSMQYLPASNSFLKYSFKYGLQDYKKINKYFDELENSLS